MNIALNVAVVNFQCCDRASDEKFPIRCPSASSSIFMTSQKLLDLINIFF
jgi:hypothetical protein